MPTSLSIPNVGTSTSELRQIARDIGLPNLVITAYAPKEKHDIGIWNLDPRGTHWIAWVIKNRVATVFDPLGSGGFIDPPLMAYLKRYTDRQLINVRRVQHADADTCGEHSICWAWYAIQNKEAEYFNQVGANHLSNEAFLRRFYSS